MNFLQRYLNWVRGERQKSPFHFDLKTMESLEIIAAREQRTTEEVAVMLVEQGLVRDQYQAALLNLWQTLTLREQEVVALICLHYTSRQIAARLIISPETVKTHVSNALVKFGFPNRNALRQALDHWDFSEWE